jgi:hypothetical protein
LRQGQRVVSFSAGRVQQQYFRFVVPTVRNTSFRDVSIEANRGTFFVCVGPQPFGRYTVGNFTGTNLVTDPQRGTNPYFPNQFFNFEPTAFDEFGCPSSGRFVEVLIDVLAGGAVTRRFLSNEVAF